ncbi:MAG: PilZ domain-containing protein [Acidobacteriota bacterium]|nr:PilZ domain-containing protein [Acidobacteriota bacterium]
MQQERRHAERYLISFPIRVEWKTDEGNEIVEEGLTENVGQKGALVHLPRRLPAVGSEVNLIVTENPSDQVAVTAQVLRLERNAAHPQAALRLTGETDDWEKKVYEYAAQIVASQKPDEMDDWN